MQINNRKAAKLITLTISALLIATVSAQSYRYLFINGTVTFTSGKGLTWIVGNSEATIDGSTATLPLTVSNGSVAVFTEVLYLKNLDGSTPHDVDISVTNTATGSNYETNGFNVTIINNATGVTLDKLDATTTDTYSGNISGGGQWDITIEISTTPTATEGTDDFAIQFTYE